MIQIALLLLARQYGPMDFGADAIHDACGNRAVNVTVTIDSKLPKEGFMIRGDGKSVTITGADSAGAMYGSLEFAERVRQQGENAWSAKVDEKPYLADRGVNLFLTLPWDYKKNDTDYDVAALTDPNRWWFQNEDYWRTLLDLMARSRLNWLDIHGSWDISVTDAPNLYAYFVTSKSFPLVGVPQAVKDRDLAQLNHVIQMAHDRGIRVSLMAYEANLRIPQNPNPPYQATEPNIYKYTKEVVEQMIREAPGLDAIGFRIGESGRSESFFTCYQEAVRASGRDIPLITRSWITRKQKVLPLARASKDFTVEIKYNGEQWGAPYIVMGGRMANWGSYSFEDYLSDSDGGDRSETGDGGERKRRTSPPSPPSKMWPGNPAEGGGEWPSEPYKIVWQVRANGTHRIFPFYNPEWVRRSIKCMKIGTASGYTVEGEDAYYPKSPDYYLAHPDTDKWCNWIHQRDEMYWMTWGRLGYDPDTPEEVFDKHAVELLGPATEPLVKAWKDASASISKSFMAYALGPDHRDHAPELEWGGDTDSFVHGQPFDALSVTPIDEARANVESRGNDGRLDASQLAYPGFHPPEKFAAPTPRAQEVERDVLLMRARAAYVSDRLTSAENLADIASESGSPATEPWVAHVLERSAEEHRLLVSAAFLRPFTDKLRMHTNAFTWASEQARIDAEATRVASLPRYERAPAQTGGPYHVLRDYNLTWKSEGARVICRVAGPSLGSAWLLVKPLPSSAFFHRVAMERVGQAFEATFDRRSCGHVVAAEVEQHLGDPNGPKGGGPVTMGRIPAVAEGAPYLVVPAQPGPTPQIYSAEEALTYLDPKVITPDKYGAMLIGSRAGQFFGRFDRRTKRKLLEPVERGMKLVILQEDFGKDKLDFLPKPLRFEPFQSKTFDPGGQLGLEKVDYEGILWQRFLPSEGWEVFGNGGLARMKLGRGEVWVTSARLMQCMLNPAAARDFVTMLRGGVPGTLIPLPLPPPARKPSQGEGGKPVILIDSCSEGGPMTSSCHPDLMNSHGIPFLTLGEVIANEQGMDEYTPIPGPVMNDDVLDGRGTAMANKFLRDRVIALSHRPTPSSLSAFEKERARRKKELMRSLGLDPMPAKTPLNARVTGVIRRDGYRIEKVVFESRPKFFVTAHVYVPDLERDLPGRMRAGSRRSRLPVILHVNGHWAHKKDEDRIQLRCAFLALQGYLSIAIDSPGWSFEGDSLIERRAEGNHNDWDLVEGGSNATGYYVWDAIRALDYVSTRSDADMSRVGITGASGGGLATLYAFAADDRYKAAVPVVYMSSMELAPDNGCLCNHVPGTCQIGDRSDVIGIQAPKPVFIMGAQNDGEFPPDAMRLTHKKMAEAWKLFGHAGDVFVRIFDGPHDYNQLMREQMVGFFNRYLKASSGGDGDRNVPATVPQPPLTAIDPEDHQLLVLDPPPPERTMRDLSLEYLANAPKQVPVEQAIAVNGGRPLRTPLNYRAIGSLPLREGQGMGEHRPRPNGPAGGSRSTTPGPSFKGGETFTFESEPGLVTPGLLLLANTKSDTAELIVSDEGKAAVSLAGKGTVMAIDLLGTGELSGIEMRYPIYAGRSVAFTGGWQIVRAAEILHRYAKQIELVGDGPMSSQAVMWAALLDPAAFSKVSGSGCLREWADVFGAGVNPIAIQPRAHLCGSLENLRKHVRNGRWSESAFWRRSAQITKRERIRALPKGSGKSLTWRTVSIR